MILVAAGTLRHQMYLGIRRLDRCVLLHALGAPIVDPMHCAVLPGDAASSCHLADTCHEPCLPVRVLRHGLRAAYGAVRAVVGIGQAMTQACLLPLVFGR